MDNPLKVLGTLWLAITIPVIASAFYVSSKVNQAPVVVTKEIIVTPTASPSASLKPIVTVEPTKSVKVVTPTVKGGVK